MTKTAVKQGCQAEQIAKKYLLKQGLIWLASNYQCRMELVFVEVRQRSSNAFGGAAASVTRRKQEKLIKTATYYMMMHPTAGDKGVRFDVLAFDGQPPQITWIKQAFEE